jgi:hypothetical protein
MGPIEEKGCGQTQKPRIALTIGYYVRRIFEKMTAIKFDLEQ